MMEMIRSTLRSRSRRSRHSRASSIRSGSALYSLEICPKCIRRPSVIILTLIVIEDLKQKVDENEQDKRFLEDQMQKARLVSTQVRSKLSHATQEYD
jgi:hypothetical protein